MFRAITLREHFEERLVGSLDQNDRLSFPGFDAHNRKIVQHRRRLLVFLLDTRFDRFPTFPYLLHRQARLAAILHFFLLSSHFHRLTLIESRASWHLLSSSLMNNRRGVRGFSRVIIWFVLIQRRNALLRRFRCWRHGARSRLDRLSSLDRRLRLCRLRRRRRGLNRIGNRARWRRR